MIQRGYEFVTVMTETAIMSAAAERIVGKVRGALD